VKATFTTSHVLNVAFKTYLGHGPGTPTFRLRMWDGGCRGAGLACNTAPVSHLSVIIIGRRVG